MSIYSSESQSLVAADPLSHRELTIFATTPQSLDWTAEFYLDRLIEVSRWSERAGCTGTLIYTDNSIVDPWLVAQSVITHTTSLAPLVAVQPVYMHPYAVAKMITSLAFLHGRRVCLNMVAGGFKNDLLALNDQTPHDRRYDRLVEYTKIIRLLLESPIPVSFEGEFYRIEKLLLKPALPPELMPEMLMSGSSAAGTAAAEATGATAIRYPEPPENCQPVSGQISVSAGIRVGIIARDTAEEAWRVAYERFPQDRRGQLTHDLAMRVSDSSWHRRLSELGSERSREQATYWLGPFENSKSNCPYLVGDYDQVSAQIRRYIAYGYRTFILDIPPSEEDLQYVGQVFQQARKAETVNSL
jgi:alkanesulfonate monooxygenase